jgi:hypothetical protein
LRSARASGTSANADWSRAHSGHRELEHFASACDQRLHALFARARWRRRPLPRPEDRADTADGLRYGNGVSSLPMHIVAR